MPRFKNITNTTKIKKILYIDRDGVKNYESYGQCYLGECYPREDVFQNIGPFLIKHNIDTFIYSPTITTGISVNELYFDKAYAI